MPLKTLQPTTTLYMLQKLIQMQILTPTIFVFLDWVAQTSIKFNSQLNLKCKLILCIFHVILSVNSWFFYEPFRADRTCSCGGILVYLSDRLLVNRVNDLKFHGGENIWIRITLPTYILHLCTTYWPEACVNPYWSNLRNSVDRTLDMSPYLYVLGDTNVDLLTVKNHKLIDLITHFTLNKEISFWFPYKCRNNIIIMTNYYIIISTLIRKSKTYFFIS